jgi:periplasmic protein TonB
MKVNIFSDDWCDLVFEDKNKEYGAYKLRKQENKRILISTIIATFLFIGIFSYPLLLRAINTNTKVKKTEITKFTMVVFEKPKKQEVIKINEPISDKIQQIKSKIKLTDYVITNKNVDDEIKTQDEINKFKGDVGNENVKGDPEKTDIPFDETKKVEIAPEVVTQPATWVPQMPEFMGGEEELMKYLYANIHYPQMAREVGIRGTVNIQFVVESDGSISSIKLLRGIGGGCDEEAMRVISQMPKWKPGKQNGKAVPVYFMLPVKFSFK